MNNLQLTILFLFATLQVNAQIKKTYHNFSLQAEYLLSSNQSNAKESLPLFAGNGFSLGASHRLGKQFGIQSTAQFTTGSINKAELNAFAKTKAGSGTYTIEQKNNSWSQIAIMTGPSFQWFAKFPFSINAQVGIGFNPNPNTILVKESTQFNYFSATEKTFVPVWDVNAQISFLKISNRINLGVRGSFGSYGGSVGIGAIICLDPICRCKLFGDCGSKAKEDIKD